MIILSGVFFQVDPTPTIDPTVERLDQTIIDTRATAQAIEDNAGGVIADESFVYEGEELYPNIYTSDVTTFFSYGKWLLSGGVETFLGQFAAVMPHLGVLFSLSLYKFPMKIVVILIALAFDFADWVANWVRKLIELIPFVQ